ncbi:hypothetical protein QPL79_04915 [Ignisphaera sp. 4213-co]|uniref:Uncharacterized protein n=1 Tax=Ignisphaera cupida TaxID=3050454 RepID=A0ABD4Z5X2_9CREN|nr:hypothetical protein [Ignisphaera sp. 4213-co]MDK6028696.1 hypothetical protein [Ignisphaera sp. 4213-co]
MSEEEAWIQNLKSYMHNHILKRVPGMLNLLNILSISLTGMDCITLFLTSPSKLYQLILTHFKGDITTTDYTFKILFLNPIAEYLRNSNIVNELLHLAKIGRDREFFELIKKYSQ